MLTIKRKNPETIIQEVLVMIIEQNIIQMILIETEKMITTEVVQEGVKVHRILDILKVLEILDTQMTSEVVLVI